MDLDQDGEAMDDYFDQISSASQSSQRASGSQIPRAAPIPQSSKVGDRRNRRVGVADGGKEKKLAAAEPGFGNAPVNISKHRKALFDALGAIKSHKKDAMMSKKDCFNNPLLDNFAEAADFLDLEETGDFIKYSAMVYGLRVDTTYNDAMSTNCQLQPANAKGEELSKKTKAEQKQQASTATQSMNLQKLNEMNQDEADEERNNSASPEVFMDGQAAAAAAASQARDGAATGGGEEGEEGGGAGMGSDDEDGDAARREEELTEEQREKVKDAKPFDGSSFTYAMSINDIIKSEVARRARNLDRKCDSNPMLMDDTTKNQMPPASILTNEYYQIATSRYKDLNASGMLTYNAKVTHNGRMTLMHKRMDEWKDLDANDLTEPTRMFRKAISGLVENSLRPDPAGLPDDLFDIADRPVENKLTSGKELQNIENKTRQRVLDRDDAELLEKDVHIIGGGSIGDDEEDDETAPPSTKRPDENGGGGGETQDSASMAPSTPAAETEASEASTRTTPKNDKEEEDRIKDDMGVLSQSEDTAGEGPRKKKLRKAAAVSSLLCEDEIPFGPVLCVDDLASKFQQILSDKMSKGTNKGWKFGAFAEELSCDVKQINDESQFVANASLDMDQMHLDKMWTSKYYKRAFTSKEVREMKARMQTLGVTVEEFVKIEAYMRADVEYEFFGEEDNWHNPAIPPDEEVLSEGEDEETQPLVRPLEDAREKKRFEKTRASQGRAAGMSDEEDGADADDGRIHVGNTSAEFDTEFMSDSNADYHDDDGGGNDYGMDDDEMGSSSRRTDFTAGDDARAGEQLGDVSGMADPLHVDEVLAAPQVRATGKTDDSHWKGGDLRSEVAIVKKERKKKHKDEEQSTVLKYFEITENMLSREKIKKRFEQCGKNFELMKETDQLLMPIQIDVKPQLDYDTSLYYKPFLLPQTLHAKYAYRSGREIEEENGADDETINLEPRGSRLEHYSTMLEASMTEDRDAEDVFLSFLRTFKHFPEVATVKEMDLEERVRSGEMAADEAAAEMNSQDSADAGAMGYGMMDDDFGGGMDDDGGEGNGLFSQQLEKRGSVARSIRSLAQGSTHGYAMRVGGDEDDGNDEADAVAKVGNSEYQLRLIKLDTVAMKTALSDVLTNPLMVAEKLNETLGHFHQAFPSQPSDADRAGRKKKGKTPMQTVHEDEEMELEERSRRDDPDDSTQDESQQPEVDYDATMMEVPDAMNVTRALFAPPKEKAAANKTVMFGDAANSSQSRGANASQEHIALTSKEYGHHTLKSTFTCLPARMPLKATSDVTVASTIAMILHLANENNLILEQPGQNEAGIDGDGNTTTTFGDWMNDFEVQPEKNDKESKKKMRKSMQDFSKTVEVLAQMSADEDPGDAQKRQKASEKLLHEMAVRQRLEKEKEAAASASAAARKRDMPGTSYAAVADDDEEEDIDVEGLSDEEDAAPAFKVPAGRPASSASTSSAPKRGMPRKNGVDRSEAGPSSTKRTRRTSDGAAAANTTVMLDDTITIE